MKILFINNIVKVNEYVLISNVIINFIIIVGKVYINDAIVPLYLYVKINDDIVKPAIKPLKYVRNIFISIPTIEALNKNTKST